MNKNEKIPVQKSYPKTTLSGSKFSVSSVSAPDRIPTSTLRGSDGMISTSGFPDPGPTPGPTGPTPGPAGTSGGKFPCSSLQTRTETFRVIC